MSAHVSLGYKRLKDPALIPFAQGVHDGLAANAATFSNLPVTLIALLAAIADFTTKYNASRKGSVAQTEAKDVSRVALIDLLNQLAACVEGKAAGNADTIRLAGFEPVEQRKQLASAAGETGTFVGAQPRGRQGATAREGAGRPLDSRGTSHGGGNSWGRARAASLPGGTSSCPNLTPGTLHDFHVAFVGGSTGTSEWSDPVSHMVA